MQVKRFVAADMRRALELVRQEMGPDAIILSSARTKQGVEIITSYETPTSRERVQQAAPASKAMAANKLATNAAADDAVPMPSDGAWGEESLVGRLMQRQNSPQNPGSEQGSGAFGKSPAQLVADIEAAEKRMRAAQQQSVGMTAPLTQKNQRAISGKQIEKAANQRATQSLAGEPVKQQPSKGAEIDYRGAWYEADFATDAEYQRQLEAEMHASAKAKAQQNADLRKVQVPSAASLGVAGPAAAQNAYGALFQPTIGKVTLNFDPSIFVERPPLMQVEEEWQPEVAAEDVEYASLKSEIADMRELLQTQLERLTTTSAAAPQSTSQPLSTVKATVQRRLQRMGLSDDLSTAVLAKVKANSSLSDSWADALAQLSHQLPTQGQDVVDKGGFFAFVGPTGAGKTTTLSKLAARFVLKHGTKGVALITLDAERIGGAEPLQRLGKILNVPVHNSTVENLPTLLQEFRKHRLVLIDTQGMRYGDEQLKRQLAQLRALPQVRSYLVLATNTQNQLMKASVHAYKSANLAGCILSKLDETVSLGEALSVVMESKIPVAYSTAGQEIPKDITVARAHNLMTKAVALFKQEGQAQLANEGIKKFETKAMLNNASIKVS